MSRNFVCRFGFILGALLFVDQSIAHESANVLPKTIYRARLVTVFVNPVTHKFENDGMRADLLYPLNRTVTMKDLAASSQGASELRTALNNFEPGLGDNLFQANIFADAKISVQQYVPALEYGVTNDLSLGIKIPIIRMNIQSSFKTVGVDQTGQALKKVAGITPLENGINTFKAQMPNTETFANALFTSNGYEVPNTPFSVVGLSDIELGGKWRYFERDYLAAAIQLGFRLPTATHIADQRNLLDQSTGDRNFDVAIKFIQSGNLPYGFTWGTALGYVYQAPNTQTRYVKPIGYQAPLVNLNNNDFKDTIRRKLGDEFDAEVGVGYKLWDEIISANVTYGYLYHMQDSYKGTKGLDYASLEANTSKESHSLQFGMSYSTVPLFRQKKLPVPGAISALYKTTIAGRNASDANFFRLDTIIYF